MRSRRARELGDYDLELLFLNVVQDHPYVLFDRGQEGLPVGAKGRKGVLLPREDFY